MKLQLTIASFTICLLFSPMLRAQESPRIVSYDLTGVTVSWDHNGSRQTDKINSNNILFINIFIFKDKSTTILQMNNNEVVFS